MRFGQIILTILKKIRVSVTFERVKPPLVNSQIDNTKASLYTVITTDYGVLMFSPRVYNTCLNSAGSLLLFFFILCLGNRVIVTNEFFSIPEMKRPLCLHGLMHFCFFFFITLTIVFNLTQFFFHPRATNH